MRLAQRYPSYPCAHYWQAVRVETHGATFRHFEWCTECGALSELSWAADSDRSTGHTVTHAPLNKRLEPYWDRVLWRAFALNTLALIVLTAGLVWLFEAPR